jgi:NAD(P)-dependent dehydrogenase (short-subunit alcohol dehydrogenase family)
MSAPTALVTGASRGIGKAIAVQLAADGHDVAISARTVHAGERRDNALSVHSPGDDRVLPGSLEETAALIEAHGRTALMVPMDLTDRAAVDAAGREVLAQWGGLDVLVHNGRFLGPGLMDVLLDTPVDAYAPFLEAHFYAPLALTTMFLPSLLERSGTLVTITSSVAYSVPPAPAGKGGWGHAYAVAKAAGHQQVPILHAEYGDAGLRCFNVEPGFVATERNTVLAAEVGRDISAGASPGTIARVVGWVVASHEANALRGGTLDAQHLARARGFTD